MVRETRHLWVGNLPEHVREEKIVEHFKRYGRVESVKVLRKRGSEGGVAAFVDFVDIKSAQKAHNAVNKMGDRDLRTDYNEPGSVPSAVRGLDDNSPSSSHGREVAGFSRGAVGPVYGPPVSLHTREGRYERRLDGSSDSRDRAYEHSPYGHHERGGTFDRPRHYNTDYYRDRTMFASGVASSPAVSAISGGFDTPETHFESRIRDPFTLSSSARRDPYRDDRGRRVDRTYHHRRSRSSHSSQSRHPSPQRTTGQTPKTPHSPKRSAVSPGRGPRSRSRSRSSSSDSVSSTSSTGSGSSDSNSSSSEGSRARSVQSAATHVPVAPPPLSLDCDEPRRSFGIRVQNLPVRSTDTSLKDGLFHEFKKYGKVTSVQIHGASEERYGLVFFRQQEDQEKALSVSKGKLFFGMLIEVTAWNGPETESENEFRPLDGRIDEFHPKATRTLFIGNLEKTTNYQQLLDVFQRFGEIVDIDIKRVNGVPQYAFVQYSDIASVCKAIKKMDGEYLGTNRLKLGFGKSMPTTCVWLDGLSANITEQYLTRHFCRYGHVVKVVLDRMKGMALILYNNTDFAQAAVRETKGWKIGGNKIKVDFASQESQMAFYRSMQASGQDIRDFYEIPSDRRDERRPPYHEFSAERAYYENVRTPGIYAEDPRRDYPARSRERYTELDHYQGDHYDPRYHEDPREYRDYRDPFEQDIRKYSYIQRERERERERFEADRGRWSPSHQRRPITPSASPSPSDRVSREAERRVYRHSSERSGSCSSLSPAQPQFEKPEKSPVDYKTESLEREVEQAEAERVSGAEKNKRGRRKEKTDREKGEKAKSRRGKVPSPSIPRAEADREPSLDSNSGKIKVSDVDGLERPRHKGDNEPSPSDPVLRLEPQKGERLDQSKSEPVDRDCKGRSKKHLKSDPANEVKEPLLDSDRLAARKRRFGDPSCKTIRQKRGRVEDEQTGGVSQPADFGANASFTKEAENDAKTLEKEAQKREHSKSKSERIAHFSQREELDPSMRVEFQSSSVRQGEHSETNLESLDSKPQPGPSIPRRVSKDGTPEKDSKGREEYLDIDLSQSYRKQMEQNRRLRQQLQEPDKPGKAETPHCVDTEDLENRSLVHEVGKPPQDVTDNSPPSKSKKQEHFDLDVGAKRERVYRTSRPKNEETDWNNTHSPRFQHAPQHAEDEYTEVPHLITGKEVKELPKPEDNAHPDTDVAVKRVHTSQMSKQSTPLLDEQQRRWENRLKQDLLPDFSRSSEKRRLNRKFLEYGLWPDLEPGEVRSDSEEDREHKPNSPMPSTSVSFPERHRGDRLSDSKLTTSLERNKFYSFALDQTITPDTKALLERAKSLSSSREDNWSFLDGDSHFASFRSRKDTEKVESTPRPTPSWYMKKKKIRSESEDKIDDRKEDPKPEEQERRELFASRFLHSSIFEQDSKRLQHLERKHEDPEHGMGYPNAQQSQTEGQPDSEPVVLFHDRFLELTRLQQQKGKEKSEQESKKDEIVDGRVDEKSQEEEEPAHQRNTVEPNVQQAEIKPISPAQAPQASPAQIPNVNSAQEIQVSAPVLTVKEMSPLLEASNVQVPSPKHLDPQVKEEKQPEQIFTTASFSQETSESNGSECQETKPSVSEVKVSPTNDVTTPLNRDVEQSSSNDTHTDDTPVCHEPKPEPQAELPELQNSPSPMIIDETDKLEKSEPLDTGTEPPVKEVDSKCVDSYPVEEPISPPPRSRNKKAKASPTTPVAPLTSPNTPDKQSTRKSERIDREKLKRSSSPRGELSKTVLDKSTGKSPIHSADTEQSVEQNVPPVRARRRNVRSVYATVVEGESAPQTNKDVESPRSARKRGSDKESLTQQQPEPDVPTAPATSRRGRPPKNRRQGEDFLSGKNERSKLTETKETDANESTSNEAITKLGKGRHSPYLHKAANQGTTSVSGVGKKVDKVSEVSIQKIDPSEMDVDSQDGANQHDGDPSGENESKEEHKPPGISETKQEKDKITQMDKGIGSQEKLDSIQEHSLDKSGRTKPTRLSRNSKLMTEDKSLGLKNLRIRLDVTEVKVRLQTGENESGHDDSSKKIPVVTSPKDHLQEPRFEKDVMGDGDTKEDNVMAATKVRDPPEALSRELELEQAVENIAKLTEDPTPLQFKSPTEVQPPLSVLVEEPVHEPEEDKPANPASETELAAAIDSITSEDMSSSLPQDQVNSVIDSDSDIQTLVPDVKVDERNSATIREETSNTGTSRKGGKGRAKAQKRAKGQKANVTKKEANKEVILETESLPVKSLEAIPKLPAVTETSPPATAAVITPSSKQDISLTGNVPDVSKATEVPLKEQPDLPKSSGPAANKSPTSLKPQPHPYECTSPSLSPTSICLKSSHLSRLPVSPTDRLTQPKEAAVLSPSITPSAPSDNPTLLPDSSPSDTNTSDLRKILSKPRNIPIPDIAAAPGSMHTRESDAKNAHENRQASLSTQPVVRPSASLPSPETKQVFSEKSVISVIASTATSVISRVCNPSDSEEKPSIPMGNPFMDKPPKQMYQPSMDDSSTYHGPTVGEEGGNAGRYIVDNTPLSTGPTAGLRVNTSEGVVVLSHSGQKIEGRQRISAKISQIPPPSAVDIESQQLVSMPQIKQDLYSASQPATPKGSLPPSDHGHSLKSQPNVPSIKSDSGLDKLDTYAPVQSGVVKRLQQTGPSQVMGFHHSEYGMVMKHPKKEGNEPLNVENVKPAWVSTISPAISPHLPSPAGNVGFIPGTPTDRASSHIQSKQEPRSPRKSGHPHSPFVSSPIGSSSPKGVSMVLSTGLPTMSQYVPSVHHSEQSVIMPPHNTHGNLGRMSPHRVAQTIPIGHLSQGDVRVNTPPLSMMSYGIHSEGLPSTWPPGQQRPTSPQAVGNREMVLKVNPANARGHEGGEEEARRFHQALGRPPATQLKPESIPAEYRGPIHSGLPLERFNVSPRDMRMLMHHQQGERPASELHQGHLAEAVAPTSTPTSITASLSPRAHLLQKTVAEKDPLKQSELKRTTSPPGKDGMMGIRSAVPSMASPQRVQLIPSGPVPPFSEYSTMYTNLRTVHSQFSESSPLGMAQPPRNITPSQGIQESDHSQAPTEGKVEHVGHQQVNMVQLLTKYPIVWQGLLALKNDTAAVQLHFVCGNKSLGLRSLPVPETGALLRIVQRMRLETPQLEGVARRMTGESDFCLLLAMPCGVDQEDVVNQTQALKSAFINYLKAKLAAGIINVPNPGSNQPAYVLQIFPPCEFSESHLSRLAPDLLSQISSISPHLMIVITSV
ncbi:msx2-interacting protein isoform X1 [Pygocentrus nattereri]|uniref:Msx2-interacting protein n=2 Tax=Pygocentrus nattereri TaxID=42514 RepID=A0AAR2J081_PYGNA|nr:msx2-interacting protein isoform X1 [Pygocentrus nattereri]XP_017543365.2 msx2-interacting protein isoform X1 [Pygocentrus nattereri]